MSEYGQNTKFWQEGCREPPTNMFITDPLRNYHFDVQYNFPTTYQGLRFGFLEKFWSVPNSTRTATLWP